MFATSQLSTLELNIISTLPFKLANMMDWSGATIKAANSSLLRVMFMGNPANIAEPSALSFATISTLILLPLH